MKAPGAAHTSLLMLCSCSSPFGPGWGIALLLNKPQEADQHSSAVGLSVGHSAEPWLRIIEQNHRISRVGKTTKITKTKCQLPLTQHSLLSYHYLSSSTKSVLSSITFIYTFGVLFYCLYLKYLFSSVEERLSGLKVWLTV